MLALISPRALLVSAIFFPTSHAGPYDLLNLAGRLQAGSAPKKTLSRSPLNLLATNSSANDDMSSNWDPVGETDIHHPSGLCETDKNVKQHSGHLRFKGFRGGDKRFFFWMAESRSNPETDPLIVWLTGGPGCSGMLALVKENGPCMVPKKMPGEGEELVLEHNPYSWTANANVVWLDNPVGTGWSSGAWIEDEEGVGHDFYGFMQEFYKNFPQFKTNDFWVTGESYAGHYIPAVTHQVWLDNKKIEQGAVDQFRIPLKGFAIGNGLTQPTIQEHYFYEMATTGGVKQGGTMTTPSGLIRNIAEQRAMKHSKFKKPCFDQTEACNRGDREQCVNALQSCAMATLIPYGKATGHNHYDMRIPCEVPGLCYDMDTVDVFFNDPSVREQIGAPNDGEGWQACKSDVYEHFASDFSRDYQHLVADMANDGIEVLIYAGDCDYICNWLGNQAWVLELEWTGKQEFNNAGMKEWAGPDGETAGRLRKYKNFQFLQVYQAGHMVPMDQPAVALHMLNRFLAGDL